MSTKGSPRLLYVFMNPGILQVIFLLIENASFCNYCCSYWDLRAVFYFLFKAALGPRRKHANLSAFFQCCSPYTAVRDVLGERPPKAFYHQSPSSSVYIGNEGCLQGSTESSLTARSESSRGPLCLASHCYCYYRPRSRLQFTVWTRWR